MSSLAFQLQSIFAKEKGTNIEAIQHEKLKQPSILFESEVASDIDSDEIFRLGLEGFLDLCKICSAFIPYEEMFFSEKAKSQQRSFLTEEENKKMNPKLNELIFLLSAHYLNESALKALEWLIRHYRVQTMNTNAFLGSFLLYHETGLFVKALSATDIACGRDDSVWAFLKSAKSAKSSVTREFLIRRSLEDFRLMEIVCENFRKIEKICSLSAFQNDSLPLFSNWISFCSVFIAEAIRLANDELAIFLFPFVSSSLRNSKDQTFISSYLFLLSQLILKFQVKIDAFNEICSVLLSKKNIPSLRLVMMLALLYETQECVSVVSDRVLKSLEANQSDLFFFLKRNQAGNFERLLAKTLLSKERSHSFLKVYLAEVLPSSDFINSLTADISISLSCDALLKTFFNHQQQNKSMKKKSKLSPVPVENANIDIFADLCMKDVRENNLKPIQSLSVLSKLESPSQLFGFLVEALLVFESGELKNMCLKVIHHQLNVLAKKKDCSVKFESLAFIVFCNLLSEDSAVKASALDVLKSIKEKFLSSEIASSLNVGILENFSFKTDFNQTIGHVLSVSSDIVDSPLSKVRVSEYFLEAHAADIAQLIKSAIESQKIPLILLLHSLLISKATVDHNRIVLEMQILYSSLQRENATAVRNVADCFDSNSYANYFSATPKDLEPFVEIVKQIFFTNCFDDQTRTSVIRFFSKMHSQFKDDALLKVIYNFTLFVLAKDSSLKVHFGDLIISNVFLKLTLEDFCSQNCNYADSAPKHSDSSSVDSLVANIQGFFELLLHRIKNSPDAFDMLFMNTLYAGTFEALATTLELQSKASFPLDYCQLLMLSVLIELSKQPSLSTFADVEATRVDVLVHCLRAAKNPHNQQQSVLCISELAREFPSKVLDCILPVFTFMGANIMKYDDPFSFYVIQNCIKKVIPVLLNRGKIHYFELLDVFINALEHIPRHRVLKLIKSLLETLSKENAAFPLHYCLKLFCFGYFSKRAVLPSFCPTFIDDLIVLLLQYEYTTIMMTIDSMMADLVKLDVFSFQSSKSEKSRFYELFYIKVHMFPKEDTLLSFKKDALQFVLSLLQSNELRVHANYAAKQLDLERSDALQPEADEMASLVCTFSTLLESVITLVLNHPKDRTIYDIMQELNMRYLPLNIFVKVITSLVSHNSILLRKRALQILNEKIQQKDQRLSSAAVSDLCTMIQPLSSLLFAAGDASQCTSEHLINAQTALLSIGILCDHFGSQEVSRFSSLAESFMPLVLQNSSNYEYLAAFFSSFKYFVLRCGPKLVSFLNSYFPVFVKFSNNSISTEENKQMFFQVAVEFLEVSIKAHGPFMSPFLRDVCNFVCCFSHPADEKIAQNLASLLSVSVQSRVLLPIVFKYVREAENSIPESSLKFLLTLLSGSFVESSKDIINVNLKEIILFYLTVFEMPVSSWANIEKLLFESMENLVFKMNSAVFQPFFNRISDWAFANASKNLFAYSKFVLFLFDSLKEIFVEFFAVYREQIYGLLTEPDQSQLKSCGAKFAIGVWRNLLEAVGLSFKLQFAASAGHAATNEISEDAFDKIQNVLLFQFENPLLGTKQVFVENTVESLIPATVNVACAVGSFVASDPQWKRFNEKLMQFSVAKHSHQKITLLNVVCALFDAFAEEYLGLLPEILPSLAELLEDNDEEVEKRAKECVSIIEKYLGEPIMNYLE